ncbi:MAG: PSD1 and planctomycete cytochrome C domain-containing protein [Blastocatellales bacterium]
MKPRLLKFLLLIAFGFLLLPMTGIFARSIRRDQSQTKVDFIREIQPIFAASCNKCHGGAKASGQLKLDVKALAMKGGISGPVIRPGSSKESRLVHRILGEGGEQRMPLGGTPLTAEQIALIKRWIDEGADWPEDTQSSNNNQSSAIPQHWAFVAPVRPALPSVNNKAWSRSPVDSFILSRIEKNGLTPSPEAEKTTLLRRLSLDLTGLPPSLKEIDDFLADRSPNAWEKQIDRLLGSPHYGERWGRWWLDAARYADTNGFEKDLPRSIWPYRDWVIKAFNEDMPFDRFTIEQLAGDLLPNSTLDQRVATGFLRNSMLNQEGGVDPEQFRVEGLIDRVDAIGNAFLGLTIKCAQCHNHKFDPIKQTEYYQFYAFLNSDDEPEIEVPDARIIAKREKIQTEIAKLEDELIARTPDLKERLAAWESRMAYDESQWMPLMDTEIHAIFGVKFERLPDGSFLARGDNATANNYQIKARTQLKNITGFRVEFLTSPNLPRNGPGRDFDGKFFVSELIIDAAPSSASDKLTRITLQNPTADYERTDYPVKNVIDGNQKTHWSSDAGAVLRNQDRKMVFAAANPVGFDGGTTLSFQLIQKSSEDIRTPQPNIGRFRLSVTTAENPVADPLPSRVRSILAIPVAERTAEQKREVFSFYRTTVSDWNDTNKKIDELLNDWPYGATTLALAPRQWPRETNVFRRGDWKRPGEAVTPDTPALMHPFPANAPRNRLGLAQWITDKKNPLTARVIVNRLWQQYFGEGLVATPEDFGLRCDPPSNAELLDWLSVEFIESGWSIKHLHRLITNSATYRQSSRITPQLREKDPTNNFLARAPRLRVEAEIIRDIALEASGLLSRKIGGPSVYPPIPDGVLSLGYGSAMPWPTSVGEDRYRRGMYTFWKRNVPYPSMLVFDQPAGDFSCTRRLRSNTPLQALTTLNDQTFVEFAQALALRIWKEGGASDEDKMIYGFRLCTGRKPTDSELRKLLKLLADQRPLFDGHTASAVYVSSSDLNNLPEDVDLHKIAPWTMVARVLLNLDETLTKE